MAFAAIFPAIKRTELGCALPTITLVTDRVRQLHLHLAQDFPLRLYQAILAETMDGDSNVLWIYLK
jgi:hypothetical protein